MSINPVTRSRWMDWKPKTRISADNPDSEPTKPSKRSFVGFDGAASAESPEIEAGPDPDPAELARASAVLNRAGVRIMALEDGATIGVWSDLDGPEVRAALHTFESDRLPVRYLDGTSVPARYKVRLVVGNPPDERALRDGEARGGTLEDPRPDFERNGLVREENPVGGVGGARIEPALSEARNDRRPSRIKARRNSPAG